MIDPQPPVKVFSDGDHVRVRRLQGHFSVLSSRSVGKVRRYRLDAVPNTGCLVPGTEAFGEDMELIPAPEPAPELSLAPDPQPAAQPQDDGAAVAATDAAAPGERSRSAAVCSPATAAGPDPGTDPAGITLNEDSVDIEEELDHSDDPERPLLRLRTKEIRYYPSVAMSYRDLKNIIYSANIKGMEKGPYEELDNDTPVGVTVTRETNGAAVWIVTVRDRAEVREAQLEVFFPADKDHVGPGCESMAIEHGVLLALRKIPIRRNDLEIMLLQVE